MVVRWCPDNGIVSGHVPIIIRPVLLQWKFSSNPRVSHSQTACSAWASNRAVKCFESAGAHGTSAVTGPPGQSGRGSLQWMKVLHCQMSGWRYVRSRVSQAPWPQPHLSTPCSDDDDSTG